MISIDVASVAPQSPGELRLQQGESTAAAQNAKRPPKQALVPEQAVTPSHEVEDGVAVRTQADAVKALVERLNASLEKNAENGATDLQYAVDEKTDRLLVKLIERGTDKVVRQIPAEDIMRRISAVSSLDEVRGLFVNSEG